MKNEIKKLVVANSVGTLLEWFDFWIYANAASLVFGKIFFPKESAVIGTLLALGTYAVGMIARPFGAAFFGYLGDLKGRKYSLMLCTLLMGICSLVIGLMPTYNQIGIWASIILILLRIIQGMAFGGDFGAASLMIYEHVPANRRGLYGSLIQACYPGALLISSIVFFYLSKLPEKDLLSWGWRLPFLVSIILIFIGGYIRNQLLETPIFQQMQSKKKFVKNPVKELITKYPKKLLIASGVKLNEVTFSYSISAFIIAYATSKLNLPKDQLLHGLSIGALISICIIPLFGYISDKIGCKPFLILGSLFVLVIAFPLFQIVNLRNINHIQLSLILCYPLGTMMSFGLLPSFLPGLFDQKVRTTGVGLSANIAAGIGGGLIPIIGGYMVLWFNGTYGISIILSICALISLLCVFFANQENEKQ
jgi:MHS family shikimate/dehydroshikimate transporter-like MFS transporter